MTNNQKKEKKQSPNLLKNKNHVQKKSYLVKQKKKKKKRKKEKRQHAHCQGKHKKTKEKEKKEKKEERNWTIVHV